VTIEGEERQRFLEGLGVASQGTLIERLEIEWVEIGDSRVVARMPVEGNRQPFGILHGGATAGLCETVASLGAALAAAPDRVAVGVELNVNHLRPVREGWVTAIATALHAGNTISVWDVKVSDEEGRVVAASRLTLAFRDAAKS
jgi:uncharacterized protein (TIGR00369 family)